MSTTDSLLSSTWGIIVCAIFEFVLVVGVYWLCAHRTIIRDTCPGVPLANRTYSLAKSQLAFWSVVIAGCYIWVFFDTETYANLVNDTVLWLLGISCGTAALSAVAANTPPPAGAPPAAVPQTHTTFLDDILSDANGMNVHRLQNLIWTVAFGIVFVVETYRKHAFPTFDGQAYALMGISSATYVWFKRGEA